MKRILTVVMLLVLVMSFGVIPAASAASADSWSFATIQVALDENIVCARYDVSVYLDGERISVLRPGGLLTFDVLLTHGQHHLRLVPDSKLADAKTWTFSISRDSYTLDCSLQAHILYLQYNRCAINEGNTSISHAEKCRLIERAKEGASFVRIVASF